MKPQRFTKQFSAVYDLGVGLAEKAEADAMLVLLDGPTDWQELKDRAGDLRVVVAADRREEMEGADEAGLATVELKMEDSPVFEKLTQALLEGVADEAVERGARVVAVYSGFEPGKIDSISFIRLDEHLGRLTVRDLRSIKTRVPLETLKAVVDLCVQVGREGREGKAVGTMFIVGDTRKVLNHSRSAGYDAVKGYTRKDRNIHDGRAREGIKEIAQLDGAFIVAPDGTVEASCQIVDSSPTEITLSKGLGSRHWAAAAITRNTKALAVVVSQSSGTVRLFQNGEVVLRIEPFRRAMKWKDFEYEPPAAEAE